MTTLGYIFATNDTVATKVLDGMIGLPIFHPAIEPIENGLIVIMKMLLAML